METCQDSISCAGDDLLSEFSNPDRGCNLETVKKIDEFLAMSYRTDELYEWLGHEMSVSNGR